MGNNPIRNFDFLGDTVRSANNATSIQLISWISQGLALKKGQLNPFYFKNGTLQVNRSRLEKLSGDQKNVAKNIVGAIEGSPTAVVDVVDKDKVIYKLPIDPNAESLKLVGHDAEGNPIMVPYKDNGERTAEDRGGGATLQYDPVTKTTKVFVQRQKSTMTVDGNNGRQISNPNFAIAMHETFGFIETSKEWASNNFVKQLTMKIRFENSIIYHKELTTMDILNNQINKLNYEK